MIWTGGVTAINTFAKCRHPVPQRVIFSVLLTGRMLSEDEVIAQLDEEGNGRLWEDEEFPADNSALYR